MIGLLKSAALAAAITALFVVLVAAEHPERDVVNEPFVEEQAEIREIVGGIVRDAENADIAGLQTIIGGDIALFSELCEKTRSDAFRMMLQHAEELGANAVIGVRYDATEVMSGVSEVLCYGTAVTVRKESA